MHNLTLGSMQALRRIQDRAQSGSVLRDVVPLLARLVPVTPILHGRRRAS